MTAVAAAAAAADAAAETASTTDWSCDPASSSGTACECAQCAMFWATLWAISSASRLLWDTSRPARAGTTAVAPLALPSCWLGELGVVTWPAAAGTEAASGQVGVLTQQRIRE
eukprot:354318-Chlamydomonas_euryale.AAC.1